MTLNTITYGVSRVVRRQMIDFKGKITLIHRVSLFGVVDNCTVPENDRKTGIDSTACKGTVGN